MLSSEGIVLADNIFSDIPEMAPLNKRKTGSA
jgi:hypothetical protein